MAFDERRRVGLTKKGISLIEEMRQIFWKHSVVVETGMTRDGRRIGTVVPLVDLHKVMTPLWQRKTGLSYLAERAEVLVELLDGPMTLRELAENIEKRVPYLPRLKKHWLEKLVEAGVVTQNAEEIISERR